jgi:Initiator Replication protein
MPPIDKRKLKANKNPLQPSECTKLFVPNHVITARYNYSLIQEKIFTKVMFHLQENIKLVREGTQVKQLDLFGHLDPDNLVVIRLPLDQVCEPDNYNHARESAKRMIATVVEIKGNAGWKEYQGLFSKVTWPDDERTNYMIISIHTEVAQMLMDITIRRDGVPINYTTFYYEYATSVKNKYTSRIYKLISSWRQKGGFRIGIDEIRDWLQLGTKYKDAEALMRGVIKPAHLELMENADVWFNYAQADFAIKDGKKVIGFNFKVISDVSNLHYVNQKAAIVHMFKTDYKFNNDMIAAIQPYIDVQENWSGIMWRLENKINPALRADKTKDRATYTLKSLLNHFQQKES